jgi:predicted component of type VI protein secretion system
MSAPAQREEDPLARHSLSPTELRDLLEAERSDSAFLAYRGETGELQLHPLARDITVTLGRRPEMALSIPWDPEVSGLHAELHGVGAEWTVLDDGLSTNGTFVNGRRVGGRVRLRDGDRIRLGRTVLVYRAEHATLVQATVAATGQLSVELSDTQRRVLIALCRPLRDGAQSTPATNQEIADEVFLSLDAVKMHLRTLFGRLAVGDLPQNRKRATLAKRALQSGTISYRDLE